MKKKNYGWSDEFISKMNKLVKDIDRCRTTVILPPKSK